MLCSKLTNVKSEKPILSAKMKTATIYLITVIFLTSLASADKPQMKSDDVAKMGDIILKQKKYESYRDGFVVKTPRFDAKEKVWKFEITDKLQSVFPSAPIYFFEIRDSDSHYRIGSLSSNGYSPKGSEKFQMSPTIRKELRKLLQ